MTETDAGVQSRTGETDSLRRAGLAGVLRASAGVLLVLAFFGVYLPPLTRSLWIDEAGMFWMARGGPLAAMQKTWNWPGQSILYSAITSLFCFEGSHFRDILLRLPALLGAAAACYILYRFANDAIGPGAGRIAAILFTFSPPTIEYATQARPYTCAMAAAAASCWTLYRWVQSRERRWLAGYVISLALVFYFHYMFAAILVTHAALLAWEFFRRRRFARAGDLVIAYLAVVLLVLPLVPHLLLLFHQAHTLSFARKPTTAQLAEFLLPSLFATGMFATGILAYVLYPEAARERGVWQAGIVAMMFVWWCASPLMAFAVSSVTRAEIFVPRYISYSGLGLVLLLTVVGYSAFGPRAGFAWVLVAALFTTGNPFHIANLGKIGEGELRPVMRVVQNESTGQASLPPVLARSDLTESDFLDWQAGNAPNSYLFAAFVAYPVKNRLVPLPFRLTDAVKDHVLELIEHSLKNENKIIFVTSDASWVPWMDKQFEKAGYTSRWISPNVYSVGIFERETPEFQRAN
ncbi:MAG TPA: glycosyltransferase family 39 protein [Bryobacteraceae bacterium]|nr:glycosyltransferase family 39 protein [Bryobacteraceae bacterium]